MKMITPTASQITRLGNAVHSLRSVIDDLDKDNYLKRGADIAALEEHEKQREWGEGSLQVSAGFIAEDLKEVWVPKDGKTVVYCRQDEQFSRQVMLTDLNRRELREMVKFLNTNEGHHEA